MIRTQQGHAVFATGHQQRTELKVVHQRSALAHQLMLIGATADDGFEFAEVGGNQAGATVDREILALRVGQHRDIPGTGSLNQRLMVFQCAFAVVGQHQHLDAFQQIIDLRGEGQGIGGKRFFKVNSQQLLVPAHDPQLDDGWLVRNALEQGTYARALETVAQAVGSFVVTGHTDQGRRRTQRGNVQGNVRGTARTIFDLLDFNDRHRGLRGDP